MELQKQIERWNNGEISNGEMLSFLCGQLDYIVAALDDVRSVIYTKEQEQAEQGYKNAGLL